MSADGLHVCRKTSELSPLSQCLIRIDRQAQSCYTGGATQFPYCNHPTKLEIHCDRGRVTAALSRRPALSPRRVSCSSFSSLYCEEEPVTRPLRPNTDRVAGSFPWSGTRCPCSSLLSLIECARCFPQKTFPCLERLLRGSIYRPRKFSLQARLISSGASLASMLYSPRDTGCCRDERYPGDCYHNNKRAALRPTTQGGLFAALHKHACPCYTWDIRFWWGRLCSKRLMSSSPFTFRMFLNPGCGN